MKPGRAERVSVTVCQLLLRKGGRLLEVLSHYLKWFSITVKGKVVPKGGHAVPQGAFHCLDHSLAIPSLSLPWLRCGLQLAVHRHILGPGTCWVLSCAESLDWKEGSLATNGGLRRPRIGCKPFHSGMLTQSNKPDQDAVDRGWLKDSDHLLCKLKSISKPTPLSEKAWESLTCFMPWVTAVVICEDCIAASIPCTWKNTGPSHSHVCRPLFPCKDRLVLVA